MTTEAESKSASRVEGVAEGWGEEGRVKGRRAGGQEGHEENRKELEEVRRREIGKENGKSRERLGEGSERAERGRRGKEEEERCLSGEPNERCGEGEGRGGRARPEQPVNCREPAYWYAGLVRWDLRRPGRTHSHAFTGWETDGPLGQPVRKAGSKPTAVPNVTATLGQSVNV